jgi:hypothetical protein
MFRVIVTAFIAVFCGAALSPPARADNFFFSFSNVTGNVPGTVSGEIFGLTNNSTSAASDIVINSFPVGLTGLPAAPFSVFTAITNEGGTFFNNSFTETNGMVTAASFLALLVVNGVTSGVAFDLNRPNVGQNAITGNNVPGGAFTGNNRGFAGATYSAAPGPIPGAGLLSYLALGLLGLGSMGWKRLRAGTV